VSSSGGSISAFIGSKWAAVVAVAVVATGVTAVPVITGGSGGGAATANLWVDENGGTCARQSTAGAYVDAQACTSFQAAFTAATGGDTVTVKTGVYTGAEATVNSGTKTPRVTIKPETGGTVEITGSSEWEITDITGLTIDGTGGAGGKGFDVHNMSDPLSFVSLGWQSSPVLANFTFKGVKLRDNTATGTATAANATTIGQVLFVSSCQDILIEDVEITSIGRADGVQVSTGGSSTMCNGITFNRVTMHNFEGVDPSSPGGDHQDGYQIRTGANIVITNGLLYDLRNGGSQEIFPNPAFDLGNRTNDVNLTIENTVIRHDAAGGAGVNLGAVGGTVTMRNNTIEGLNTCTSGTDCDGNKLIFRNNLIEDGCTTQVGNYHGYALVTGGAWSNNVLGGACGWGDSNWAGTTTWSAMFTAIGSGSTAADFHLVTGSYAIDKGSSTAGQYVATDKDGASRFLGAASDAGAYEKG
jgi:hypothetical protein